MEEFNLTDDALDIGKRIYNSYFSAVMDYFNFSEKGVLNMRKGLKCEKRFRNNKAYSTIKPPKLLLQGFQDICIALKKFYASLIDYKVVSKYLSVKNPLRIYYLHGESIHSVLGVCIVIDEIAGHYGYFNNGDLQQIHVTADETRSFWRRFCTYMVERMNKSFYRNVEIKLDLLDKSPDILSDEFIQKISETDVFFMTRYFEKYHVLKLNTHFLEVIFEKMKKLSILFYLDDCYQPYCSTLVSTISKTESWMEIKHKEVPYEVHNDNRKPFNHNELNEEYYYYQCKVLLNTDFPSILCYTYIKHCETETTKVNNFKVQLSGITKGIAMSVFPNQAAKTTNIARKLTYKISQNSNKSKIKNKSTNKNAKANENFKNLNSMNVQIKGKSMDKKSRLHVSIKTKEGIAMYVLPNPKNNDEFYVEGRKSTNETKRKKKLKKSNFFEKSIFTNLQNNDRYLRTENLPEAKSIKPKKRFKKLVFKNSHCKYSSAEENSDLKAIINDVLKMFVLPERLSNNKRYVTENKSKPKTVKRSKVDKRTAGTKLAKKEKDNRRNTSIKENTKEPTKNLEYKPVCNDGHKENSIKCQTNESINISESKSKIVKVKFSTRKNRKTKVATFRRGRNKNSIPTYISTGKIVTKEQDHLLKENIKSNPNSTVPIQSNGKVWTVKEFPVKLTKKSVKRYAGQKIKLIGKFAKMDLEKKNKDERYKMMAKQASFNRYVNFDYD